MRDELNRLFDLQQAELRARELRRRLDELPRRRAVLDAQQREAEAAIARAMARREELRREHALGEAAVRDLEERREHYKSQLMSVKSNREFQALQHEIDGVGAKIGEREDAALRALEGLDEAEREIAGAKAASAGRLAEIESERRSLAAEESDLRGRAEREEADAESRASGIPAPLLAQYRKIASARDGVGVSLVAGRSCTACREEIRPALLDEARVATKAIVCEGCRRLLLVRETAHG